VQVTFLDTARVYPDMFDAPARPIIVLLLLLPPKGCEVLDFFPALRAEIVRLADVLEGNLIVFLSMDRIAYGGVSYPKNS
jgi:hypothetical protein